MKEENKIKYRHQLLNKKQVNSYAKVERIPNSQQLKNLTSLTN